MKKTLLTITVALAALAGGSASFYGCCKGCAKGAGLIPGFKGSGIPDVRAAKEHQKEIEQLGKELQEMAQEEQRIAADPALSPEEKQRRILEVQKRMEPKVKRMQELSREIMNQRPPATR